MPTPDSQPEVHRLSSPVPRKIVFPVGSFGSMVSAPTEFCAMPLVTYVQVGFAASALLVRQTPLPAVPAHSLQLPGVHVGATTNAVTRLAVEPLAPENESTPGSIAVFSGA